MGTECCGALIYTITHRPPTWSFCANCDRPVEITGRIVPGYGPPEGPLCIHCKRPAAAGQDYCSDYCRDNHERIARENRKGRDVIVMSDPDECPRCANLDGTMTESCYCREEYPASPEGQG